MDPKSNPNPNPNPNPSPNPNPNPTPNPKPNPTPNPNPNPNPNPSPNPDPNPNPNPSQEGIHSNEYTSGKYKLGGDWVKKMPRSLAWFNHRLEHTIFPAIAALFPEIVSGPSVLRAHSVAILKYNASHPRTDVHVDDGVLAMTLALSPRANYSGGGTFFEHMGPDNLVEMEQGQCTFRPGSVRHGGNKVTAGERYILGGFLLISDRVEHVRRLNNQGRAARNQGDLSQARNPCSLHCHAVAASTPARLQPASTAARLQALVHVVAASNHTRLQA